MKNKITVVKDPSKLGKPQLISGRNYSGIGTELVSRSGVNGGTFTDNFDVENVSRFPAEIRNPTLNPEMFFLPKFLSNDGSPNIELNTWWDHYYRFHPIIANLINLHSTLPISRFGLVGINDSNILQEYEEYSEDLHLFEMSMEMLKAYFLKGEYALYARWNDDIKGFSHLKLLDPNYINVVGHYLLMSDKGEETEFYELTPDEYLQALVSSENDVYRDLVDKYLDDEIRSAIENGFSIMLEPFSLSFEKRTVNPWDLRGTSILCNILKSLILEDKLREYQYANAQMNTTPIYHWKIGDSEYPADDAMIMAHQALIQNLAYDPNKSLITNHLVNLSVTGAAGQTKDMFQDFEYIQNLILTALWGNKAFTHSEGITYNSSSVAMRVLMGRYIPIRNGLENIMYRKLFLPTAIARGYYKRSQAELSHNVRNSKEFKDLVIPQFDWRHKQSLMDDANVRSMLIQLHTMGKMPMKVICESIDQDYDYVMKWLEKETNTIFDPFLQDTRKVLTNSAAAGTLKDSGEGMMKRVMDASIAFVKALTGKSPNVDIKEQEKKKQEEEEDKEKEKVSKIFSEENKQGIDYIIRKHASRVEEQLKEPKKFKTIYSNNDLIIKSLTDNHYDKDFIGIVRDELYDLKLLLSKKGMEYVNDKTGVINEANPVTAQRYLNLVIEENQEEYNQRLRRISEIAIDKTDNSINKEAGVYHLDFAKYALSENVDELELVEKNVLKQYWNNLIPKIQIKAVLHFIDLYRKKQIQSYRKMGVKEFYVNSVKIADIDNFKFETDDRLVPDFGYKIKKNVKLNKFTAENIPVELVDTIKDLDNRFKLKGSLDLKDETFETIDRKVKSYHLGYIFDNLRDYNDLTDLESKFGMEEDERTFFINSGLKYLNGEQLDEEIRNYIKNLYI